MSHLTGVAGALVDERSGLVFTSNSGKDTVGIFDARDPDSLAKVPVGVRPNGLAFDPTRRTLVAANVGDPADPTTHTLSVVDPDRVAMIASIQVPGRTRWTVFDPTADAFFVNIADPPSIVVLDGADPTGVARTIDVGAAGPHGLEVDQAGRLYCACDAGLLFIMAPASHAVVAELPLAGSPDVIWLDSVLRRLYVAIGDPGLLEVFDVERPERFQSVPTGPGVHTIGLDSDRHRVYAFLPTTHRAAVFAAGA